MMQPNAHVRAEIERIIQDWWAGYDEGYHANANQVPLWYFNTPPAKLTARQRGYWFGRELKLHEKDKVE